MSLVLERVDISHLDDRAGVDLYHLTGIGDQLYAHAGAEGTTNDHHEIELPVFDMLAKGHSVGFVEEHHMRTHCLLAFWALAAGLGWAIRPVV